MIDLEQTGDGVILPVQAQPRARKNAMVGLHAGRLKVAVTQPPEKGKANGAISKVLADTLGVKRSQVRLVSGVSSPQKKFLVAGARVGDLLRRIHECLQSSSVE